ncbi:MAG: hypothetical protein AAF626_16535 [Pseudomonadota bacterium]
MAEPEGEKRTLPAELIAIGAGVLLLFILLFAGWSVITSFIMGVLFGIAVYLILRFGLGWDSMWDGNLPGFGSSGSGADAADADSKPAAAAPAPKPAPKPEPAPEPASEPAPEPAASSEADVEEEPAEVPAMAASAVPDVADEASEDTPAAEESEGTKPEFMTAAREGGPDDLKQIKGVGPKLEELLHELGVFHFDQIAGWGAPEVAWMDGNLQGFRGRVSRDEWVDQAKILASGGTTEFSKKVDKGDVY